MKLSEESCTCLTDSILKEEMGEQDTAVHRTPGSTGAGLRARFRQQARNQLTLRGGGICASKGVETVALNSGMVVLDEAGHGMCEAAPPADLTAAEKRDAEKRALAQMVEAEEIATRVKFDELKQFGGGCAVCACVDRCGAYRCC